MVICRKTIRRATALLLGTTLVAGCAGLAPKFEHPRLSVVGVEMRDASLAEQHVRVKLRVYNPNTVELPVEGISYTVDVAGEELGRGVTADSFTVPAHGEAEFEVLMTTNLAAVLFKVMPSLKESGHPIEYHLVGKVNTSRMFLRSIPFDERGTFQR
jgi:LEA14-like dessication related protein